MTLSNRTKISISQFLGLLKLENIKILFEKYGMEIIRSKEHIYNIIKHTDNDKIAELVREVIGTQGLRNEVEREHLFNDTFSGRLNDLEKCLFLDGYKVKNDNTLVKIEPNIDGVTAFEDELTHELRASGLSASQDIITLIEQSANNFKRDDFDGCLNKGRKALETLVEHIAIEKFSAKDDIEYKEALGYLTEQGFLKKYKDKDRERELLKIVHYFISDGSHKFLRDEEYTRYSRNLTMSMCYYVIKKYNYENRTNGNDNFEF